MNKEEIDEIDKLKKINEAHRILNGELMGDNKHLNDLLNQALKDYDKLQQKINEAIEYIETNKRVTGSSFNGKEYDYIYYILECEPSDLLEILRGDCNE